MSDSPEIARISEVIEECSLAMQEYLSGDSGEKAFSQIVGNLEADEFEAFREHFSLLSHKDFKNKKRYMEAVKFVTLTRQGLSPAKAYRKVFPDRYEELERRVLNGEITPNQRKHRIDAYRRNNTYVAKVEEALNIPVAIAYHDYFIRALNVQVAIMEDEDIHARDRAYSANSLMTTLAPKIPENTNSREGTEVNKALDIINKLVVTSNDFAKSQQDKIIEGEFSVGEAIKSGR